MKKLILILGLIVPGMALAQNYIVVIPPNTPWNTIQPIQPPAYYQRYQRYQSWQDAYWQAYWNARRAGQ
jgi:hypothetical protein